MLGDIGSWLRRTPPESEPLQTSAVQLARLARDTDLRVALAAMGGPTSAVDRPMITIVIRKVYLRPARSPTVRTTEPRRAAPRIRLQRRAARR